MGSFALYSDKSKGQKLKTDIHFNLWSHCDWKDEPPYLDIGVMAYDLEPKQKIYFYVPFALKKDEVFDLGKIISEANLSNAIFNEKYSIMRNAGTKWTVALQNEKKKFAIFALNIEQNIDFKERVGVGGTCLQFSIPAGSGTAGEEVDSYPCNQVYFRFRLRTPKIKSFMREYTGPSRFLSQFTKRIAIDFRYNDTRSFNDAELEEFTTDGKDFVQTRKVHFLLMSKAHINVECAADVKRRTIEGGLWNPYVKSPKNNTLQNTDDIIAYHATKKVDLKQVGGGDAEDIGSFEFFAKQNVEIFTVWRLLLITIGLSIVGNGLWSLITWLFSYFEGR